MEEIKVNMENLSEEERKQLLTLIDKANDNGKKQKMIDQIKENYKSFYGKKFDKLPKQKIYTYYKFAENTINGIFAKGYGDLVEVVPSPIFTLQRLDISHEREYIHIPPQHVYSTTPEIPEQIARLFCSLGKYTKEYKVYIYLPLYMDFNDDVYKTLWTYRYVGSDKEKRVENIKWT